MRRFRINLCKSDRNVRMVKEVICPMTPFPFSINQLLQQADSTDPGMDVRSFNGKHMDASTIRSILQNEKYTGDIILQKTFVSDALTHTKIKNNSELPQYQDFDERLYEKTPRFRSNSEVRSFSFICFYFNFPYSSSETGSHHSVFPSSPGIS